MATVDSNGWIVLPKEVGERFGITPWADREVREDDVKMIDEPEDDPRQIIERMEKLVAETSSRPRETTPFDESAGPIARKHKDAVRRGADDESEE